MAMHRLSLAAMRGLLIAVASPVAEHVLQGLRAQELWRTDLGCSTACGIILDHGSNLWPLQWQVDSHPVYHEGSLAPSIKWSVGPFLLKVLSHFALGYFEDILDVRSSGCNNIPGECLVIHSIFPDA